MKKQVNKVSGKNNTATAPAREERSRATGSRFPLSYDKKFLVILGIISFTAFLIRLQVCSELSSLDSNVANPSSVTDMFTYKDLSEKIMKGEFKQVFYYQPFYYAVFLPLIKFFFGNGIWAVMLLQSLLSALTVWFAGLSARMIKNSAAGITTALLLTFSVIMILFIPYYLIATLQAFWVTLILYMCVKLTINQKYNRSRSSWKYYAETTLIGFIVGLAILTRGNIWIFTPGIAIFIISAELHNRQFKKAASALLLFTLFLLLPQLPFIWHNTKINGKLTAPSTAAGAVLSLGNTPESPPGGRDPGSGAGPMEYPETCRYWGSNAEKTPVYLQMLKWFKREPLAFSELLFRKMLLFWDYREIPNNLAIETQGLKSRTLRTIGFLPVQKIDTANSKFEFLSYNLIPGSLLILTLGVAGILSATIRLLSGGIKKVIKNFYKHLPEYILLYLIISYWLGTALFYILGRFRVPIIPLLAISGSIFICRFYSFYKRFRSVQSNSSGTECKKTASPNRSTALRNTQNSNKTDKKQHYTAYKTIEKKMLTTSFIILLSAFFTVTFGYSLYRYGFESKIISFVRPYGVRSLIGERTLMIKDNGPLSFGSWTPFELHDGDIIDKRFILPEKNNNKESISLKIECYCQVPGKAILNINGKKFTLNEKNRGMNKHTFTIPPLKSNRIRITPVNLDCRLLFFLDRQRNYGRTEINGKNPEAELVSSLYIESNKKK